MDERDLSILKSEHAPMVAVAVGNNGVKALNTPKIKNCIAYTVQYVYAKGCEAFAYYDRADKEVICFHGVNEGQYPIIGDYHIKPIYHRKINQVLEGIELKEYSTPVTRAWKVYGREGHRQRESFCDSYAWSTSEGDSVRIVEVFNSDMTGTNEYSIIRITRNTLSECFWDLEGQLSDGVFENSNTGWLEEIDLRDVEKELNPPSVKNQLKIAKQEVTAGIESCKNNKEMKM